MNQLRSSARLHQQGMVTVMAVLFLITAVIFVLSQTLRITGSNSIDNSKQMDSVDVFFLAESGLERAQGILAAAADPTVQSVCHTDIKGTSPYTLGRGSFTLTGAATSCDKTLDPIANCTSCTVTSTGTIGSSSRTLVRVITVASPSGGAVGCGGGGVTPVNCPLSTVPASQKYPKIEQDIEVTTPPAVVLSNMAFLRHPSGPANNINAAPDCVTTDVTDVPCATVWNDQSNSSSGSNVVGSRGASAVVTSVMGAGTYALLQNLTSDSLFAAVGAKFGASGSTVSIVGSYWNDSASTGGTASGNATGSGTSNNGAACATPGVPDLTTCPNLTTPPGTIGSGSSQTSRNWCNDADTLVFGFSGSSSNNNNGALTGFQFGTSPASRVPTGNSIAAYPKPVTGTNSQLYSALRYIYNPSYLSATDAISGAVVTGHAGTTFTANITKNAYYLEVTSVNGAPLASGVAISVPSQTFTTMTNTGCKTSSSLATDCATSGGAGFYGIQNKNNADAAGVTGSAAGSVLTVIAAQVPKLTDGDTIFYNGISTGASITWVSGIAGGVGTYNLSTPLAISSTPNNITSDGMTVTTSPSIPPGGPTAGQPIAIRWTGAGTGVLAAGTTVDASATPTGTSFILSKRPTTPLSGVQICGGICAFFNHASANASTNFTIAISGTSQWAAGMTCLKGVNPNDIVGLTGTSAKVKATDWHEVVK